MKVTVHNVRSGKFLKQWETDGNELAGNTFKAGRMEFRVKITGAPDPKKATPRNEGFEFLTLPYDERVAHLHNLMKLHLQKCEQEIRP